ncbi:MAG: hypothetical protein MUC62_09520 [Candidatus Thermoplasmatota archaeon]|jgi:hypothetical protein|nr:hypothetical protein [Candidatus Thermoplasmatota archaeon]
MKFNINKIIISLFFCIFIIGCLDHQKKSDNSNLEFDYPISIRIQSHQNYTTNTSVNITTKDGLLLYKNNFKLNISEIVAFTFFTKYCINHYINVENNNITNSLEIQVPSGPYIPENIFIDIFKNKINIYIVIE